MDSALSTYRCLPCIGFSYFKAHIDSDMYSYNSDNFHMHQISSLIHHSTSRSSARPAADQAAHPTFRHLGGFGRGGNTSRSKNGRLTGMASPLGEFIIGGMTHYCGCIPGYPRYCFEDSVLESRSTSRERFGVVGCTPLRAAPAGHQSQTPELMY